LWSQTASYPFVRVAERCRNVVVHARCQRPRSADLLDHDLVGVQAIGLGQHSATLVIIFSDFNRSMFVADLSIFQSTAPGCRLPRYAPALDRRQLAGSAREFKKGMIMGSNDVQSTPKKRKADGSGLAETPSRSF